MERIKQALDRARQERQSEQATSGSNTVAAVATDSGSTQTRTVNIDVSVLRENRIMTAADRGPYIDAYKILRTQLLQKFSDNKWNALAVTSTSPGEGKTLTAINLAICIAMEVDYSVLLVEANLLHPNMHEFFGLPQQKGLSEFLLGEAELPELLFRPSILEHLVVLPGGRALPNSSEMLNSPRTRLLVEELRNKYPKRIIVFDLPPVLATADAVAFVPYVDAALLVIEEGKTNQQDLWQAVELLERTEIIGTVLNKVTTSS